MELYYAWLCLAPLCGTCLFILVHMSANRLIPEGRRSIGFLASFLAGNTAMLFQSIWATQQANISLKDTAGLVLLNQLTYLAISYCYVNFVLIMIASLRIRILHELSRDESGRTVEEMLEQYNARGIIDTRLRRLTEGGHLVLRNDRYHAQPGSVLMLAQLVQLLTRIVYGQGRK